MSKSVQVLPQVVDMRGKLASKGTYAKRTASIKTRAWHHSLTKKILAGSTAEAFARYHVNTLGWPGLGYHLVIEPQNIIKTKNGDRARIVWAHDFDRRTYHVGNSNNTALGICVAGDYRTDKLDDATLASIAELHTALVKDGIGTEDKSHQEMPGYAWKECCAFDYKKAFAYRPGTEVIKPTPLPKTYTIQEGDTLWSIAKGLKDVTVDDLLKANPKIDPTKLQIGQVINLAVAQVAPAPKPKPTPKPSGKTLPNAVYRANRPYPSGAGVRQVQEALAKVYFYPDKGAKNNGVDGVYGPKTADAVRRFQLIHGLASDGVYGPATRAKLLSLM